MSYRQAREYAEGLAFAHYSRERIVSSLVRKGVDQETAAEIADKVGVNETKFRHQRRTIAVRNIVLGFMFLGVGLALSGVSYMTMIGDGKGYFFLYGAIIAAGLTALTMGILQLPEARR